MSTVLITGGTKGIGFAIAEEFARQGNNVIVTYFHDKETAEKALSTLQSYGIEAKVLQADSSNKASLEKLFGTIGSVDILINNIGARAPRGSQSWEDMFQHHMMGTVYATELFAAQLQGEGSIINISSILGSDPLSVYKGISTEAYNCVKASVDMYTKICAAKYAGTIRVNAVSPGNTLTAGWEGAPEDFMKKRAACMAIGRFLVPEEIASFTYAVATNKGITGQILTIDGGKTAK